MRQGIVQDVLHEHTAREAMFTDCPHISSRLTLDVAVEQIVAPSGRRCFPVIDDGQFIGLLTLPRIASIPKDRWQLLRVEDAMISRADLKIVQPDDDLATIVERMTAENINQYPVVERGRLLGMVGRDSLLNFIRTRAEPGA